MNVMRICVYGASSVKTDEKYINAVESLCETLAKKGHSLVYGGGANGLMGASARGFTKGGGHITGVAPHFFNADGILYDKCDELIRIETMRERKQIMEDKADVFIMVPGGVGTFDEFFEILTLKQLARHSKAIIVYNIFGYYDKLQQFMEHAVEENFINPASMALYEMMDNTEKIVEYIDNYNPETLNINDTKYI